jgi:hypothetical protein
MKSYRLAMTMTISLGLLAASNITHAQPYGPYNSYQTARPYYGQPANNYYQARPQTYTPQSSGAYAPYRSAPQTRGYYDDGISAFNLRPNANRYGASPYNNAYRSPYGAYNRPMYRRPPPSTSRFKGNKFKDNKFWGESNKFWGDSPPDKWFPPKKDNWETAWDDMINAPSRQGQMPGGWYAPEVYFPNPVDVGDQFKDNAKDLPEQIKDMDVGNTVEDTNEDK